MQISYPEHLISFSTFNLSRPHVGANTAMRDEIADATKFLDEVDTARKPVLVHRLYCIVNDIHEIPKCVCGKNRKLAAEHRKGFMLHCSNACAQQQKSIAAHSPDLLCNDIASQRDMHASGMSLVAIAKHFGVSANKIVENLARGGTIEIKLSGDMKTDLQILVEAGHKNPAIAQLLNINTTTLSRRLGKLGITRHIEPPDSKILCDLYNTGKCMEDISKLYGVSGPTVKKWLLKAGVELRPHSKTIANSSSKAATTKLERYGYAYYPDTIHSESAAEIEVRDFLNSHGGKFVKQRFFNEETGKWFELDGYDEERHMAFEYCGLYWHCEKVQPDKYYHARKHKYCEERGISLFTIFEDEWTNRKKQVSQFLLAKMGVFDQRITARKCKISKGGIPREFFSESHIQGAPVDMLLQFGLHYMGSLVGAVSVGRHHRNTKIMCVNRLAFAPGIQCVGGASRLLNVAYEHVQNLVTWSDCRWTNGEVYRTSGFVKECVLAPDYSYADIARSIRISKQSQKKSKTGCPAGITEHEWAKENGLFRIWDCGKIRWHRCPDSNRE